MATDFNIQLPPAENTPTFRIVKTLASSIKPLGDRTVMMLNKDGFVKAFNEAEPHFPTREEAVRVRNYIFFQLQQHYQKKGKTFLFRDWLTEHNLLDIFFVNESTQKERYQKPIEREAKLETKLHNLECSIVVKCLALFHEGNRVAKPDFFRDNASSLDSLSKTERVINASVGSRDQLRKAQARIRDLEIDTQPAFNTTFTTSNDGEQSTDMVNMYYGLWGTEYYLRKASGTYIFRYMSPDLTKWFEMYNNTNHFAEMELDLLDLGYELPVPSATSDAGGYFVYSGLVPRHQKEYLGRLTDITGRVVHILLAILTYCNSHATAASKEVLAEMLARRETITPMDIFTLEWYWQFYLPKEETFPEDIRKVVRESPVVTEFVTLLTLISSPTPRESPHLVKLLDLLQYATGWKVGEFVEKEDERQSAMAFEAFQRADREESCLVFSDEVYKVSHYSHRSMSSGCGGPATFFSASTSSPRPQNANIFVTRTFTASTVLRPTKTIRTTQSFSTAIILARLSKISQNCLNRPINYTRICAHTFPAKQSRPPTVRGL